MKFTLAHPSYSKRQAKARASGKRSQVLLVWKPQPKKTKRQEPKPHKPQVLPPLYPSLPALPVKKISPYSFPASTIVPPKRIATPSNSHLSIIKPPSNEKVIRDFSRALEEKDAGFFFRTYKAPYNVDIKRDGERNWLFKKGKHIALINKHTTVYLPPNSPFRNSFSSATRILPISPSLEGAVLRSLGKHDGTFDVEYGTKDDDLQTFAHEHTEPNSTETKIYAFDAMELDGKDVRGEPLSVRREILEDLIHPNDRIEVDHMEVAQTREEAEKIAKKYQKQGFEGGMIKPAAHKYDSSAWQLKEKRFVTADVVILGIELTKDYRNNGIPRAFVIGMKQGKNYRIVGKVGTGLSNTERKDIGKQLVPLSYNAARQDYTGDFIPNVSYVKPTQVLEVGFSKVTPAKKLREPRIIRSRWDKGPELSLMSQIA